MKRLFIVFFAVNLQKTSTNFQGASATSADCDWIHAEIAHKQGTKLWVGALVAKQRYNLSGRCKRAPIIA
jgi:hypothetical protein